MNSEPWPAVQGNADVGSRTLRLGTHGPGDVTHGKTFWCLKVFLRLVVHNLQQKIGFQVLVMGTSNIFIKPKKLLVITN